MKYSLILITSFLITTSSFASFNDNDPQDQDSFQRYVKVKVGDTYPSNLNDNGKPTVSPMPTAGSQDDESDAELAKLKSDLQQAEAATRKLAREKEIADLKAQIAAEHQKQQAYTAVPNVEVNSTPDAVNPVQQTTAVNAPAVSEEVTPAVSTSTSTTGMQDNSQNGEDQLARLMKNIQVEVPRALDSQRIEKNITNESKKAAEKVSNVLKKWGF